METGIQLEELDRANYALRERTRVSSRYARGDAPESDRNQLARAGKKQVLKRNFDLVSMIGFSSVLVSLWEDVIFSFQLGLINGGQAGLIYGFIFAWIGMLCVYITLGELSSMVPTSGGQYHWVSILAPRPTKIVLSYICGWLTVLGWVGATTSTAFFTSSLTQALLVQKHPDYDPKGWQGTLLMWAVLLLVFLFNTMLSKTLPVVEVCILIIHLLGFFAILIPILYLSPKENPSQVFTTFGNLGGWNSQGLSFLVGLSGTSASFIGADGAVHMSEEIRNATRNVPRAMVFSTVFNGILAFAMLIAFLICAGTITDAESSSPYPFIPIFNRLVGSNAGAVTMVVLIIILQFCSCIAATATASRMMWAFARDRGLPMSRQLSQFNIRTTVPTRSVVLSISLAALFGLINIGSTTVFNDVISLVGVSLYGTYLLACGLLLYRRTRGDIGIYRDLQDSATVYTWGPWCIHGGWGIATNFLACLYLVLLGFFSFWPSFREVTPATMNYSSVVFGAAVIFSGLYYMVSAHRIYKGPVVEI